MLRFLSDENFDNKIVRGLKRQESGLDLDRAQDRLPQATSDPDVLTWAATEGRVVLTHDRETMPGFAYDRVARGEPMPGVIVVRDMPTGQAIYEILLHAQCISSQAMEGQVIFLPL